MEGTVVGYAYSQFNHNIRVTYDLDIRYAKCPLHLSVMSGFRMVFPPIHVLLTVESHLVVPVGDGSGPVVVGGSVHHPVDVKVLANSKPDR